MSILQFFKKKSEVSEFSCTSSDTNSSKSSCYFATHKYASTVEHKDDDGRLGEEMTLSLSSRLKLKRMRSSEAINLSKEKKIYNETDKETCLVSEENKTFADNILNKINTCNSENATEENTSTDKHSELENSPVNKDDNHEMNNIPYYLKNFKYILDCVFQNDDYARLFNEDDQIVIQKFNSLSDPEQKLFVRLFQRKNKWFRSSKLDYSEIASNIKAVLHDLYINNFLLDVKNIDDVECALNLLTIPELRSLCKMFQIRLFQKGKKEMIAMLIKQGRQSRSICSFGDITNVLLKRAKSIAGDCYKLYPEAREVFIRVMILFSLTSLIENEDEPGGGLQQQLYTLLMVNTGKIVFPSYKINRKTTLFQTRNDLIMYVNAKHLESEILQKMENKKFEDAFQLFNKAKEDCNHYNSQMKNERDIELPTFLRNFTPGHVYIRCLTHGVDVLQRLRKYKEAVKLLEDLLAQKTYRQDCRGYWWDRLALNLDQHLKQPEKSISVIEKGLNDEFVKYGHRLNLYNRAKRLKDTLPKKRNCLINNYHEMNIREIPKLVIKGRLLPRMIPGRKHLFISSTSSDSLSEGDMAVLSVEELALEYYRNQGYAQGIHGEGPAFVSLFCLYFWTEIYECDIPDVFLCPHQTHPLDLNSDAFFKSRKSEIEKHLEKLKQLSIEEVIEFGRINWHKHKDKMCLIQWDKFIDWEQVESLIRCLRNDLLVGICKRLAENFRHCRSGAPDLIVWNQDELKIKFVEVKGPGDQLSSKQILWLDYLLSLNADAEVCYIEAINSRKLS